MDKDIPDWASIENDRAAREVSDMLEAVDVAYLESADAIEQVRGACEAIKSAELTHDGVHKILLTLSRRMLESSRFTDVEAASIEDMASDF
jgi:hypothetical protein